MAKRPHIIIINPDEMRWDTMGHMGNRSAHTPALDAFAVHEAVSFDHAYCQNPVCGTQPLQFFYRAVSSYQGASDDEVSSA